MNINCLNPIDRLSTTSSNNVETYLFWGMIYKTKQFEIINEPFKGVSARLSPRFTFFDFNCIFSRHSAMELYWCKWQVLRNLTENRASELVIV